MTLWKLLKPHERTCFAEYIGMAVKPMNLKTMIKSQQAKIERLEEQLAKTHM